nr:ATP-binding protein [Sporosarcina sp. BP05]
MRDELKFSLEQTWEGQRKRELQVKALGHDIKTPLTIIKGNAELITEMDLHPEIQGMLEDIIGSAQHLSEYAMSLTELDTEIREEVKIDVRTIFNELQQEARSLTLLDGKSLEWKNLLHDPIMLRSERTRLKRAFMNLIANATERAREKVTVTINDNVEGTIEFTVLDDGRGFSEESQRRAKEAFYTDDPSRHNKHQGLGLYIAQSVICDDLGGNIIIENIVSSRDNHVLGASVICRIPS